MPLLRAPVFHSRIVRLSAGNHEAVQHLDRLYLTLQSAQGIAAPTSATLTAKLDCVEAALAPRLAALDEFVQRPNATAHSVVEAFVAERASANPNAVVPAAAPDGQVAHAGGAIEPDASAVYRAIALEPFRRMAAAIDKEDVDTKIGRLNALAAGFDGQCVLGIRMLCEGGRQLSLKHPALAKLFDLRSHLPDYFTWCLTADASGTTPSRLKEYAIVGPPDKPGSSHSQREGLVLLDRLLKFELDSIDWINSPGGVLALKAAKDGGKAVAKVVHPEDIYTIPDVVTDVGDFIHQLLVAMGAPKESANGYTFQAWTRFYVSHLECAKKLQTRELRLEHLDRCHEYFLKALRHYGSEIRARIYCAQPDLKTLSTPILTDEDEPVAAMKQWETEHETALNLLYNFRGMFGPTGGAPTSSAARGELDDPWVLPRRSQRSRGGGPSQTTPKSGQASERGVGRKRGRDETGDGRLPTPMAPGTATWAHLWLAGRSELLISGRVWKLRKLSAKLKLKADRAVCWPVLLSARVGDNKLAHCERYGQADHTSLDSLAHQLQGFQPVALLEDTSLWRYPTEQEKSVLNAQRVKAQSASTRDGSNAHPPGRNEGKGRGAARRPIRGGWGFRQPSTSQVE